MRASGNGNPQICAHNLLCLFRGEVPYERVKGLDPRMIDRPISTAEMELKQDAKWLIETYEPRATVNAVTVTQETAAYGGFSVVADITEKEA